MNNSKKRGKSRAQPAIRRSRDYTVPEEKKRYDKKEPERDENGIRQELEIKQKRRKEAEES